MILTVDHDKCERDGICVAECPMGIIRMEKPDGFPSMTPDGDRLCINCGHCVAVCPRGAVGLRTMRPEECEAVPKGLLPTPGQVALFLRSRRSVRCYREKPVPREILLRLLDSVRYAPSAHNDQPVHWIVFEDRKEVKNLASLTIDWIRVVLKDMPETADVDVTILKQFVRYWEQGEDPILRGAPHLIIGHVNQSTLMAIENCTIALTYLELAACSMGLGACWAGAFQIAALSSPSIMAALQLPEGHRCYGAMMLGYPRHQFPRIPLRNDLRVAWR